MTVSPFNTVSPAAYRYPTKENTESGTLSATPSADTELAQEAGALSATAGIVATLGAAPLGAQTYDAAGLYNSIAQAGIATTPAIPVPASANTQSAAQQTLDSSVIATIPAPGIDSGLYDGTGTLQDTSSSNSTLTANWSNALKENPHLAQVVATDSYAQGIVGILSATA